MSETTQRRLILLGPQPEYAGLRQAVARLQIAGPVALITAGWQSEELDEARLQPLRQALPADSVNLELFRRSEDLFEADPGLIDMLRRRQDELRILRDVYRLRLEQTVETATRILGRHDDILDLGPEQESAIESIRLLDRQYHARTREICDQWESRLNTAARPEVVRHRNEINQLLAGTSAIAVSGGHAAIILNRLRIFGILETDSRLPLIAWSGGAMALSGQVVLFHDSPPQGRGGAEVLRAGMGAFDRYLPLPDARHRLLLDDPVRVSLFARRFDGFQCVVFDESTLLDRDRGAWSVSPAAERLSTSGQLTGVTP